MHESCLEIKNYAWESSKLKARAKENKVNERVSLTDVRRKECCRRAGNEKEMLVGSPTWKMSRRSRAVLGVTHLLQ